MVGTKAECYEMGFLNTACTRRGRRGRIRACKSSLLFIPPYSRSYHETFAPLIKLIAQSENTTVLQEKDIPNPLCLKTLVFPLAASAGECFRSCNIDLRSHISIENLLRKSSLDS
jgi:hypothetical protein